MLYTSETGLGNRQDCVSQMPPCFKNAHGRPFDLLNVCTDTTALCHWTVSVHSTILYSYIQKVKNGDNYLNVINLINCDDYLNV